MSIRSHVCCLQPPLLWHWGGRSPSPLFGGQCLSRDPPPLGNHRLSVRPSVVPAVCDALPGTGGVWVCLERRFSPVTSIPLAPPTPLSVLCHLGRICTMPSLCLWFVDG